MPLHREWHHHELPFFYAEHASTSLSLYTLGAAASDWLPQLPAALPNSHYCYHGIPCLVQSNIFWAYLRNLGAFTSAYFWNNNNFSYDLHNFMGIQFKTLLGLCGSSSCNTWFTRAFLSREYQLRFNFR